MEQAQILSLMAKLENKKEKDTRKSEPRSNNEDTKYKPRPWRTKPPKDGEPTEKVSKGGHTFKWNPSGNDGTGFWDFVKPVESASKETTKTSSTSAKVLEVPSPEKKKSEKTVTFNDSTQDATTILVNKNRLLSNLGYLDDSQKAFISQFVPKE